MSMVVQHNMQAINANRQLGIATGAVGKSTEKLSSGFRINRAADVEIGNHVWIGYRVLINKGSVIPDDTVVGTGAIVTKSFDEPNTVLAGVPAKVVKRNVNWCKERL